MFGVPVALMYSGMSKELHLMKLDRITVHPGRMNGQPCILWLTPCPINSPPNWACPDDPIQMGHCASSLNANAR